MTVQVNVREATKELHDKVEKTEFAQRMFRGELTVYEYTNYLASQFFIFSTLEKTLNLIEKADLHRSSKISDDIQEILAKDHDMTLPSVAFEYGNHLFKIKDNAGKINAHIYLNYMGLLFGGKIMAPKQHGSGRMYQFEDPKACVQYIREQPLDVEEVKYGFELHIKLMEELDAISKR